MLFCFHEVIAKNELTILCGSKFLLNNSTSVTSSDITPFGSGTRICVTFPSLRAFVQISHPLEVVRGLASPFHLEWFCADITSFGSGTIFRTIKDRCVMFEVCSFLFIL